MTPISVESIGVISEVVVGGGYVYLVNVKESKE